MRHHTFAIAAAVSAGLALSACSGSPATPAQSSSRAAAQSAPGTASESPASLVILVRALGQCIHQHGAPNFPEPTIGPDGQVVFPEDAPDLPPTAETACQSIISRLPTPRQSSGSPIPTVTLQKWLAFAGCMRTHGLPAWPDPNPDGTFNLPASIRTLPNDAIAPAFGACQALSPNPNGKFDVSGSGG